MLFINKAMEEEAAAEGEEEKASLLHPRLKT